MRRWMFGAALLPLVLIPAPAWSEEPTADPAPMPTAQAASAQTYLPDQFARFSPRNALDMLSQVPGFSIRSSDQQRGLGQATGNVLFNGARPSAKSDDIFTQLQRIPAANVVRIEIVDGASLDVPGLSGQVANIVFEAGGLSGQFSWEPEFRPHNTDPVLTCGNVSVSGKTGHIAYEAGLDNSNCGHGGADGLTLITDGNGTLLETRQDQWQSQFDSPKLSGKLTWTPPGGTILRLHADYQRVRDHYDETGVRTASGRPDELRTVQSHTDSWNFEIGGDAEFALGPGRFKAIALRSYNHEPNRTDVISEFADGSTAIGDRFVQTGRLGETIARGEYTWKMLGGDWQLAGEAAFNTLDSVAGLFTLDSTGTFTEVPFPEGSGGVSEDRYEGSLSYGRNLTSKLSVQLLLAAEQSTLVQTGTAGLQRSFLRPKGTLSLAWKPRTDLDLSVKLQRRVGQLSFYDFLARAFLNDNNQNAGNTELRPQQDWSVESELNKKWGPWGSSKVQFVYRDVEDRVEIIPIGSGQAVGNIPKAWAAAIVLENTFTLDPAGLKGVKLETSLVMQTSRLRDPFTGEQRDWNGFTDTRASFSLRHDIPHSDWAWGANADHYHDQPVYRSNQTDHAYEGPWFGGIFVENKNVHGLTVRARVGNIFGARSYRDRVVYQGLREASPIAFVETRDRRIGPIFSFSVRGNF